MGHDFDLNRQSLQKIDNLLPRLKHSISPTKIINWLENFEKKDVDNAIDLLQLFEYITFDEILYRFNDLLEKILKQIPIGDQIIILPYGKVGKSGSLITYPLMHTKAFIKRARSIILTHDFEKIDNPSLYNHIIFIDDFIGSGGTFHKEYKIIKDIESWITKNSIKNTYILSSIIMKDGKDFILKKYPNIQIHAEVRNKLFDPINSPLKVLKNILTLKTMAYRYGSKIDVFGFPYGYDNSQSLISFFHCTPNNTLPIIWKKNENWVPLFPRNPDIRMSNARKFKKDIAFMIGICNRLGIDLYKDENIVILHKGRKIRDIKYNSKIHHSIVALIRLKQEKFDDIVICHILGLTMTELEDIYMEGRKLSLIDTTNNLSISADLFIKELYNKTRKEKFRKETYENLKSKNTLYLPQNFKGY
ncbi:hypothetical protein QWY99_18785 [Flavobacterium branchiarum]|uniref:Uncharacterized protein n=1 Tax=Flavobacterium branchiarum TaxID=1114870 RepID=A0ABV5FIP2_9FLAO|nr:hypothetical protein [Flavobacterium branchiarum]MDN3675085.1 hypothetical protein [Flavobacterium branchiarum]